QQLDRVRDRLQQTMRPNAHRPEPHLHVRENLAFEPVHGNHGDGEPREDQHDVDESPEHVSRNAGSYLDVFVEVRRDVLDDRTHQRSTSPSTISSVPITAITSATNCPRHITSRACKFTNDGGRTRNL